MIHNEKVILYFLHKIALDLDRSKILYCNIFDIIDAYRNVLFVLFIVFVLLFCLLFRVVIKKGGSLWNMD